MALLNFFIGLQKSYCMKPEHSEMIFFFNMGTRHSGALLVPHAASRERETGGVDLSGGQAFEPAVLQQDSIPTSHCSATWT